MDLPRSRGEDHLQQCSSGEVRVTIGVRWGAATDAGRVRELNEDSLLAEPPLFAVADGVGGHAAGEVASGLAVAGLGRFVGSRAIEATSVLAAVRSANGDIRTQAASQPPSPKEPQRSMGSTVVGLALSWLDDDDTVLVFNVGDSRAFRLTEGRLAQVSRDHSLVDELLRAGHITPEEALVHPHRSVITRALGAADDVDVDSWQVEARVGDRYLLCSDGLTNEVAFDELQRVLASVAEPQDAAEQLIALALEHGGRDNVTAVIVDVTSLEPWPGADDVTATVASRVDDGRRARRSDEPSTKPLPEVDAATEHVAGAEAGNGDRTMPVGRTVEHPADQPVEQGSAPALESVPVPGAEPTEPMLSRTQPARNTEPATTAPPGRAGSALHPPDDRATNPGLAVDDRSPHPEAPPRRSLLRRRPRS